MNAVMISRTFWVSTTCLDGLTNVYVGGLSTTPCPQVSTIIPSNSSGKEIVLVGAVPNIRVAAVEYCTSRLGQTLASALYNIDRRLKTLEAQDK